MDLMTKAASTGGESFADGPLLSPEEAAARLRCSAYAIARWRLQGRGPKWRRIGPKRVAYAIGDIHAFLARA
jgi:hypothetical protein